MSLSSGGRPAGTSSPRRDGVAPAERFAASQAKPSPEPAGRNNAAWHAYWRNKGSHRGDEQGSDDHPRDGGQRREEETRRDSCGDNRGNRSGSGNQWKDDRERETRRNSQDCSDNRGNRSDSGSQWKDDRERETRRNSQDCTDNRGNRSDSGNQWKDDRERETRRNSQDCSDNRGNRSGFGSQWKDERERNTRRDSDNCGDNRGNRSDNVSQWKDGRGKDTQRDTQNWVDNRGNRSDNGNQWRDVLDEQTYGQDFRSSRGNRSDKAGDWTADLERYRKDSQDFRYKQGNESDRGSERSPREGRDGQRRWGDSGGGYTDRYTRKEPQRQASTESRTGFSGGNFRNESESRDADKRSQSSARSAYHPPRSPEYQQNQARSPGGGFFNRNANNARRDSGFGNKCAFDNSERRDGNQNQRSTYQPRKVKLDLGSNSCDEWDVFDGGPRTGSPRDRFEQGSRGSSSRRGFPKSPNAEIKEAVEELWDLEPVREKTPPKTKQEIERGKETTPTGKMTVDKSAGGSARQESAEVVESGHPRSAGQGSVAGMDVVPHKMKSAENVASASREVDKSDSTGRLCPETVGEVTKIGTPMTSGLKAVDQGEDTARVPGVDRKGVEKRVVEKSVSEETSCRGETGGALGKGDVVGGKTQQARDCTAKRSVIDGEEGLEEREGGKTVETVTKDESGIGVKGDASKERHGNDLKKADEDVNDPQHDGARNKEMEAGQENEDSECGNVEQKSLGKVKSTVDCEAVGEVDQETLSGGKSGTRKKEDSMKQGDAENIESLMSSLSLVEVSKDNDSGRGQPEEDPDAGSVYSPPTVSLTPDGSLTFMLSYVESPSRFWVHPVSEKSSSAIDKIMHDLNQCYKTANKLMLQKLFEGDNALGLNSICCAQFSQDNDFYRTEIVSVRYEVEEASPGGATVAECVDSCQQSRKLAKVKVFYLDFGNSEWLSPKHVYPLPPMFTGLAPQAVCCRLVDLEPIAATDSGAEGDGVASDVTWSTEATEMFTELTGFDKQLYGYVTTGNKEALR